MTDQNDKFDETLTTHQRTNGEALTPKHLGTAGCERGADEFGEEGDGYNAEDVAPGDSRIEETNVRIEPRKSEVKWQEQTADQIFDLLSDFDGEPAFVRTDQTSQKSAEDGMHPDGSSEERASKTLLYCQQPLKTMSKSAATISAIRDASG